VASSPQPAGVNNCSNLVNGSCPLGTQPCNAAIDVDVPTVSVGVCTASQTPKPFSVAVSKVGIACGQTSEAPIGQGCSSGQVCMPKVQAPYQEGLCVKMPGEVACPALFPNQHIYYDTFTDGRSCSSCSCGNPAGASCSAKIQFFTDSACSTNALLAEVPTGSCKDISGNPAVVGRKAIGTTISPGSCAPSGGQVGGTVDPVGPTTFCCK
jgi:hypothetical protein